MRTFWNLGLLLVLCLQIPASWAQDRLIIMAGQSNMMGRGTTYSLPDAYKQTPKNISFFYQGRPHKLAEFAFFGPEVAFAHDVARAFPHDHIILVKQAVTGSFIKQWLPDGPLYNGLLRQVGFATDEHPAKVDAFLWMQGESDARSNPQEAQQYGSRLEALVQRLRADTHAPQSLFILGQINPEHPAFLMTESVRQQQQQIQQELPNAMVISTDGLGKLPDRIHYDADGQIQLGKRFAEAYIKRARS
ncbi:MAG: sialate O-acetylesterase [Thiothrix sp.]|jgi:lysophospholipase L1-like esterase|uniref:sialate O-acetylesterase n=1 Tax=Thiothrix sp. TaxID=1032 RepID=UPI002610F69F|nr:sialate O-acetylesterase [Thiothrix sp.]MDD5392973.1 sialate O-acetylesterase [Thiothrix sp.]